VIEDLAALFRLIDPDTTEVVGREGAPIPAELRKKLARFAAGECNDQERHELLTLVQQQRNLIPVLANEIKRLRNSPKCP
jgi:hypothetical protein